MNKKITGLILAIMMLFSAVGAFAEEPLPTTDDSIFAVQSESEETMPNIPQVKIGNTIYDVKDTEAREQISDLKSALIGNHATGFKTVDANEANDGYIYVSGSSTNIPILQFGYLITISSDTKNYRIQFYTPIDNDDTIYYRLKVNGTWANWNRFISNENASTLNEIVSLSNTVQTILNSIDKLDIAVYDHDFSDWESGAWSLNNGMPNPATDCIRTIEYRNPRNIISCYINPEGDYRLGVVYYNASKQYATYDDWMTGNISFRTNYPYCRLVINNKKQETIDINAKSNVDISYDYGIVDYLKNRVVLSSAEHSKTVNANEADDGYVYVSGSSTNIPRQLFGYLLTFTADSTAYRFQFYTPATEEWNIYFRIKINGAWGNWNYFISATNTYTIDFSEAIQQYMEDHPTIVNGTKYSEYVIAASDSTANAKAGADYICNGSNDCEIINNLLSGDKSIKLFFRNGTYHLNRFFYDENADCYAAIMIGNPNVRRHILLQGENQAWIANYPNYDLAGGVQFVVDDTALNNVDQSKVACAIHMAYDSVGKTSYTTQVVSIDSIAVVFQDNQRPNTTGIDLACCGGMDISNCYLKVAKSFDTIQLPAADFIGVDGLVGSKFSHYNLTNVWAMGFDKAYRLSGENIVAINTYAYMCNYPFWLFKSFTSHSCTFIKCGEERCVHGILIDQGITEGTSVSFINYDIEVAGDDEKWLRQEGAKFKISWQSGWLGGIVTYCATKKDIGSFYEPFWKDGHGTNFTTIQGMDKRYGATADRPPNPTMLQQFYDQTLGKMIFYNGTNWVDYTGDIIQ